MVIIRVAGGLGNQMQQFAMYRKLRTMGRDVKLDLVWFRPDNQKDMLAPRSCELDYFKGLKYDICTDAERSRYVKNDIVSKVIGKLLPGTKKVFEESRMYHPEVFDFTDKYLEGFFLCNKYYDDILPELQKGLIFPEHSDPQMQKRNEGLMKEMTDRPSASVHLRRGDYITEPQNFALFGNIATDEYYQAAMDYVAQREPDVHFYIFSNDAEYAREMYPDTSRYTIVTGNDGSNSMLDMQLMSKCKYNICANSTFSFWGARLNSRQDKVQIRTFKMRNNQEVHADEMHDYWKDWVLIDENGRIV